MCKFSQKRSFYPMIRIQASINWYDAGIHVSCIPHALLYRTFLTTNIGINVIFPMTSYQWSSLVVPITILWSTGEIDAQLNTPHGQRKTINLWSLYLMNIMFVRITGYSFSPHSRQAEQQLMDKKTHVFSGNADALIGIRRPVWMPRMKHQWLNGHWLVFGFCMLGFWSLGEHFCIGFIRDVRINSDSESIPIQFGIFCEFWVESITEEAEVNWVWIESSMCWIESESNLSFVKSKWIESELNCQESWPKQIKITSSKI